MSKSSGKKSRQELGEQKRDSIYDFIYYDADRVNFILSQIDDFGVLKEILKGEKVQDSSRSRSASIGVNTPVGGANASINVGSKISGEKYKNRKYDPFWANAIYFLDLIEDYDILSKDVEAAGLGSIVLIVGDIEIVDLGIVKKLYEIPELANALAANPDPSLSRQQKRRKKRSAKQGSHEEEFPIAMLKAFPHTIQMRVNNNTISAWGNLVKDFLVTSTEDLMLKHSSRIDGRWYVAGILDARPDLGFSIEKEIEDAAKPLASLNEPHEVAYLLHRTLVPMIRGMLGRSPSSFGITPLLVFRKIV